MLFPSESLESRMQAWLPLILSASLNTCGFPKVNKNTYMHSQRTTTKIKRLWNESCWVWRRKRQPTPVLLPGKFHGWRSLVGYSPWGHKESDTTGRLHSLTQGYPHNSGANKPLKKKKKKVVESCPSLCNWMDCSLPGSSVHGIAQTRILEWVAVSFSRESSWSQDQTQVSWIAGRFFTIWATGAPA